MPPSLIFPLLLIPFPGVLESSPWLLQGQHILVPLGHTLCNSPYRGGSEMGFESLENRLMVY